MKVNILDGFVGASYVLRMIRCRGEGTDKKEKERRIQSVGTFAPTLYPCLYRSREEERARFIAILAYCRKPAVGRFFRLFDYRMDSIELFHV